MEKQKFIEEIKTVLKDRKLIDESTKIIEFIVDSIFSVEINSGISINDLYKIQSELSNFEIILFSSYYGGIILKFKRK